MSPDNFIDGINFLNAQGAGQLVNVAGLQFQITPNENEAQRMSIGEGDPSEMLLRFSIGGDVCKSVQRRSE